MRLTIVVGDEKATELDLDSPTPRKDDNDHLQVIAHPEVRGQFRVSRYELFKIIIIELQSEKSYTLELVSDDKQAEMFFLLEGEISCQFKVSAKSIHGKGPSHNICYASDSQRTIEVTDTKFKCLIIEYALPHFMEYLEDIPRFRDFRLKIMKNEPGVLYSEFEGLNEDMRQLLHEIECCSSDCPFQCIHIKIKVLELLLNQFKYSSPVHPVSDDVPEHEYDKIIRAKSFIEANFTDPPGIPELARQVGSNEFYLKKGFKSITGNTVYGYVQHLKMNKAVELLQEKDRTIQQVAEAVGYKYAQHFSTAFKKKYGMTPGDYKKLHVIE